MRKAIRRKREARCHRLLCDEFGDAKFGGVLQVTDFYDERTQEKIYNLYEIDFRTLGYGPNLDGTVNLWLLLQRRRWRRRNHSEEWGRSIARIVLMSSLLAGCSAQVLDDIGEITPPRSCAETVKLFNTFSMQAKSIAWKGNKGAPAELTLNLVFYNDKNFPVALSNSGNGVHYAVRFSLQGKEGPVRPKEATGIVLTRDEKALRQRRNPGPFGEMRKRNAVGREKPSGSRPEEQTTDVNFRIRPGEPQEGRLVFQLPRDNYLLTIERQFAESPRAKQPSDLIAVCKIPQNDVSGPSAGISGVY